MSLATVTAVGLVVAVLLTFLAMANGFQRTHRGLRRHRHRHGAAWRLGGGNQQRGAARPGPADRGRSGDRQGRRRQAADLGRTLSHGRRHQAQHPNQGEPAAARPRPARRRPAPRTSRITAGRMFNPGSNEIVVGKALGSEFAGFDLGQTVNFGSTQWTVVGIFSAEGSVFESEIWADLPVLQSLFKRNAFQTVRARLTSPAAIEALKAYSDNDPRLKLDVISEAALFRQAGVEYVGPDPEARLAAGDRDGVRLAGRRAQHHVLARSRRGRPRSRPCAPSDSAAFRPSWGPWSSPCILAAIGGLIGAAATYLVFDGFTASTMGGSFSQVVFNFQLSPRLIGQGLLLALIVGLSAGCFRHCAPRACRSSKVCRARSFRRSGNRLIAENATAL